MYCVPTSQHPGRGGQTQAHCVPRGDVHGLVRAGGQAGSMLLCAMDEVLSPPEFLMGEPHSQWAGLRKGGRYLGAGDELSCWTGAPACRGREGPPHMGTQQRAVQAGNTAPSPARS